MSSLEEANAMISEHIMWYDKDGKPLTDYNQIERLLRDPVYKRVGLTKVGDWQVSTVWLALNQSFMSIGRPVIFETMAFSEKTGESGGEQERYSTLVEAQAGHKRWVARYKRRKVRDNDPNNLSEPE